MTNSTVPQKRKKVDSDEADIIKDGALTSAAENFFEALCKLKMDINSITEKLKLTL
jgi:hypothetical protein